MSEGVYEAARCIRPYLPTLAPEDHDSVDAELAALLNDPQQADTETRLVALLEQRPATAMFMDAVLDDAPEYRPPQVVEEVLFAGGYSPPPGQHKPPPALKYCCPHDDYKWFIPRVGTPVPSCPTHHVALSPC